MSNEPETLPPVESQHGRINQTVKRLGNICVAGSLVYFAAENLAGHFTTVDSLITGGGLATALVCYVAACSNEQ